MSGNPDLSGLLGRVGQMQKKMAEVAARLGELTAEGAAGGGAVRVVANGRREVVRVTIDPAAIADGDVELLEDLIRAATNVALKKAGEAAEAEMRSATGLDGLPALGDADLGEIGNLLGGTD